MPRSASAKYWRQKKRSTARWSTKFAAMAVFERRLWRQRACRTVLVVGPEHSHNFAVVSQHNQDLFCSKAESVVEGTPGSKADCRRGPPRRRRSCNLHSPRPCARFEWLPRGQQAVRCCETRFAHLARRIWSGHDRLVLLDRVHTQLLAGLCMLLCRLGRLPVLPYSRQSSMAL
jgi:hypothetical protein